MIAFFDASALVKRYVAETDSETVRDLLHRLLPATARLSEVEVASALERRCREGSFSAEDRDRAIASLRQDIEALLVVELTSGVVDRALNLLAHHPLRAGDALQLASCLELRTRLDYPITFVAFDDRLNVVARREGLETQLAR